MPSFAELRAKAEAAASSAKESANSKIADYRGDKKPEKHVYKAPPRRPAVKPPLPPETSRPRVAGYDLEESIAEELEEDEPVRVKESKPVGRAALGSMVIHQGKGIEVLLDNKELFFQFLDEFFAAKGYDVHSRLPISQHQEEQRMEEQEDFDPEEDEVPQGDDPTTPTETPHRHQEVFAERTPSPPPRPPIRNPPPQKPKISKEASHEPEEPRAAIPPRRLPPPIAHKPAFERNLDSDTSRDPHADVVVSTGRTPAKPSSAVQALFSNLQAHPGPVAVSLPLQDALSTSTSIGHGHRPAPPARPVRHSIPGTPEEVHDDEEELPPPPPPLPVKPRGSSALGLGNTSRLSKLLHTPSSKSGTPDTPPAALESSGGPSSPPFPPLSTRPPPVNRASRPGATATPSGATSPHVSQTSSTPASLSNVRMRILTGGGNTSIAPPPSMFFTGDTNEEWTPPLPYGYMPSAGRKVTEGQCSAAQLCSYFAAGVPWDSWYTVDDSSARPASIVDRVEARWKGSVVHSQETKKRLFGAGKTKNERCLTGVVTFQDLSIAWYRVTYREEDPIKSLQREARYRAAPSPWNGEKLYAAHLLYGQAITDFCERAIRMRQLVGGGEAWDLANGALTCLAKYVPNAPPVIPSVGHCHGHLIYEGYVDEGSGRTWGATRGGETAIRNGDIIEWCDAQVQIQDEDEEITIFSFGSGYPSVILSAVEFPEKLDEDAQTLPPTRLPDLEIVMQSAASGMVPTRKLALLSTLEKGRIWIYRPVGWEYVGLKVEPDAEWPPPDPTLFLPS